MAFFGMYFQDTDGREYRVGFHTDLAGYQPEFDRRLADGWSPIGRGTGLGDKNLTARELRRILPQGVPFNENHTQNEVMELIRQSVYNLMRAINENVNYRGAHR